MERTVLLNFDGYRSENNFIKPLK